MGLMKEDIFICIGLYTLFDVKMCIFNITSYILILYYYFNYSKSKLILKSVKFQSLLYSNFTLALGTEFGFKAGNVKTSIILVAE